MIPVTSGLEIGLDFGIVNGVSDLLFPFSDYNPVFKPFFRPWLGPQRRQVLDGVMFNKDVTHSKMRRRIENPRVLLLDCPLEYKKGEVLYAHVCVLFELMFS